MVFYGQKYFVEAGSYDIRKAFARSKDANGVVDSEADKLCPPCTWDPAVEKVSSENWTFGSPQSVSECTSSRFKSAVDRVNLANAKITWGTIVACMAGVTNPAGLKAARFFLGVAEAGMLPGVVFYMSFWYKPTERATRVAWYFGGSSIAGGVSGLIAIGAGNLNGKGGLKAWQWLFIIEGVFSVLYGIMAHFVMLDYPETPTTVLTPAERDVAMRRLPRNAPKSTESDFDWVAFWDVMAQPAQWLFLFSYLTLNIGVFGATAFLPSVLQGLGFTGGVSSNLASIGPNFATLVFYVAVSWHSDFTRERMWHYVIPMTISTIGSFFLTGAAYNPPSDTNAYRTVTLKGSTEVGMALGWMTAISFVGALISPFMYPDDAYPEYVAAILWGTISYALSGLSVLFIPLAIRWQSRALVYLTEQGLFDTELKSEADAINLDYDKTLLEKA
ncbi:MFS general substrate transporter [Gonapodya prolifera JEL478]|uniref:MFS general substrate transporter n=1 Tax=Gonapodya prolifera (strain JEL478) TaxID=1344416 RepID=A0A139AU57_GONPJ|nr:MFS general substrate transporter [Gonapodya prolifera JEL478]|eukprot:KXS20276.1 MFS general substrate transporter [Gonapodya prolifera JEL478]